MTSRLNRKMRRNSSVDKAELGISLRSVREAHGWTLEQLASQVGVTKGYLSRLEGGKAQPAANLLKGIAAHWKIDPGPLLILAGFIPDDVDEILRNHPVQAVTVLRESFGSEGYDKVPAEQIGVLSENPIQTVATKKSHTRLVEGDCFHWMNEQEPNSIHAIVTDPPYGLKEYSPEETSKLRRGQGGVWRIPPKLNGYARSPIPRFTVLNHEDRLRLKEFFNLWAKSAIRILVPGAHVFIASNPLLSHLVYIALADAGFEKRGEIIRLVQTLRGGDRPKNAHEEFDQVTVMPRSCWEPWGLFRKPCEGRVQDNLRKWKTGGLRRIGPDQPFCDVIRSAPTRPAERDISPHPSLKPQAFMRQIVRASLPLGEGTILDPFMGGGSTIAAAVAVGYHSVGVEMDLEYFAMAKAAIPRLARSTH